MQNLFVYLIYALFSDALGGWDYASRIRVRAIVNSKGRKESNRSLIEKVSQCLSGRRKKPKNNSRHQVS